jgi:hypothetical protein
MNNDRRTIAGIFRQALLHFRGGTPRTLPDVHDAPNFDFTARQQPNDAARPPLQSCDAKGRLHAALTEIREEMVQRRARAAGQQKLLEELQGELQAQSQMTRVLLDRSVADLQNDIQDTLGAVQMSMAETLDAICEQRLSLVRFGDGELKLMAKKNHSLPFQHNSAELRLALKAALNPDWVAPGRVLVSLPPPFRGDLHWLGCWINSWSFVKPLINPARRYGHSLITRPAFFRGQGADGIAQWRRLWLGRQILVVTGRGSRFDLVPELFESAGSVDFLFGASEHAFAERESILQGVVERAGSDALVLLSLGPTATFLAHRIAAAGIQALDIGHISASYKAAFDNGPLPEAMPTNRNQASP